MKVLIFITLLFLVHRAFPFDNPFIPRLENTLSGGVTANAIKSPDSSYFFNISSRLSFRDFDIKMCYRVPSTKFSAGFKSEYATYDKFTNIGAAFRLHKIVSVPLTFMAGRLNVLGSLSKLRTPYISTGIRNFGDTVSLPKTITLSLPSTQSVSKPATFAALYNSKGVSDDKSLTGSVVKKLDFALLSNENADFATASSILFKLPARNYIGFSQTLLLCKTELKSSSWYSDITLSAPAHYWFSNNELYYNNPHFKVKFTANIYHLNTDMTPRATFCLESNLLFKWFSLNLGGFYASDYTIFLPSSNVLRVVTQLKANPVLILPLKVATFKIGGTYYIEERLNRFYKSRVNQKYGAGVAVTNKAIFGKASFECVDNKDDETLYKIVTSLSLKSGIHPTFGASYSFSESTNSKNTFITNASQRFLQKTSTDGNITIRLKESMSAIWNNSTGDYLTLGLGLYLTHRSKYFITNCAATVKCKVGI